MSDDMAKQREAEEVKLKQQEEELMKLAADVDKFKANVTNVINFIRAQKSANERVGHTVDVLNSVLTLCCPSRFEQLGVFALVEQHFKVQIPLADLMTQLAKQGEPSVEVPDAKIVQ